MTGWAQGEPGELCFWREGELVKDVGLPLKAGCARHGAGSEEMIQLSLGLIRGHILSCDCAGLAVSR